MRQLLIGAILGLAVALVIGATWTGPAARPAAGEELGATGSVESWYLVFSGSQKVGQAYYKATRAYDTVILEEKFQAVMNDRNVRFDDVVVYSTAKPIRPTEAKMTTYYGATKVMEGSVTFAVVEGSGLVAHVEITGFVDKNRKALDPPAKKEIDMPVPDGLVVLQPALPYLGPRVLLKDGKLDRVVYGKFPESVEFPTLLSFKPDYVLERKAGEGGQSEVVLKGLVKTGEGTKTVPAGHLVVNAKNEIVEYGWAKFVLKPCTEAEAAPPGSATPAKP